MNNAPLLKTIFASHQSSKNILLLAPHDPIKDPRLDWTAGCAPTNTNIIQVGTSLSNDCILTIAQERLLLPQKKWTKNHFNHYFERANSNNLAGTSGIQELLFLEHVLSLSERQFCLLLGAPLYMLRNQTFRAYLKYILQTTAILLDQTAQMSGLHAVIATDLPTLPTALVLKGLFNIPIIYDAHEYWPEADVDSYAYETQFWQNMENRLIHHVDYCQTVSTGLARLMSEQYKKNFAVVPNCVPLKSIDLFKEEARKTSPTQCRFIYQGIFAPERGLDLLIQAWSNTNEQAILLLRGPDSSYKDLLITQAQKTGLLNQRIYFLPAVREDELIQSLHEGDVGLIPYTPFGQNYTHCCPNKLSQYMAARLPILANNTQFITSILKQADAGVSVDFSNLACLIEAIAEFIADPAKRIAMGENGYTFATQNFHWEKVSATFYEQLASLIIDKEPSEFIIFAVNNHSKDQNITALHSFLAYSKLVMLKHCIYLWKTLIPKKLKSYCLPVITLIKKSIT
jgi:glycosyltransferase involved in cell wall biosynthesis